jgi:hypothetical protein
MRKYITILITFANTSQKYFMIAGNVLIKKIKVPFYGSKIWIVVSPSLNKSIDVVEDCINHKIIKEEDKKSTDAYTYAFEEGGAYFICVFLKPTERVGNIAHEALHAVNILHHWHGVRPSYSNDESVAYFLGWLVDRCHTVIGQYKKKFTKDL